MDTKVIFLFLSIQDIPRIFVTYYILGGYYISDMWLPFIFSCLVDVKMMLQRFFIVPGDYMEARDLFLFINALHISHFSRTLMWTSRVVFCDAQGL